MFLRNRSPNEWRVDPAKLKLPGAQKPEKWDSSSRPLRKIVSLKTDIDGSADRPPRIQAAT